MISVVLQGKKTTTEVRSYLHEKFGPTACVELPSRISVQGEAAQFREIAQAFSDAANSADAIASETSENRDT